MEIEIKDGVIRVTTKIEGCIGVSQMEDTIARWNCEPRLRGPDRRKYHKEPLAGEVDFGAVMDALTNPGNISCALDDAMVAGRARLGWGQWDDETMAEVLWYCICMAASSKEEGDG
jgi:hypothetical protein